MIEGSYLVLERSQLVLCCFIGGIRGRCSLSVEISAPETTLPSGVRLVLGGRVLAGGKIILRFLRARLVIHADHHVHIVTLVDLGEKA